MGGFVIVYLALSMNKIVELGHHFLNFDHLYRLLSLWSSVSEHLINLMVV